MSTIITKANKINIPIVCIMFSTFLLIGFFLIASMVVKRICDPSNAGKGNKLKTAKFAETNGIKINNERGFACVKEANVATVVTGPPISFRGIWNVISIQSDFNTIHARPKAKGTHLAKASQNE